jgi:hypothetical protein
VAGSGAKLRGRPGEVSIFSTIFVFSAFRLAVAVHVPPDDTGEGFLPMHRLLVLIGALLLALPALAQKSPFPEAGVPRDTTIRTYRLDSVEVIPQAELVRGMLLLNRDIQLELGGAVDNMYNFKFGLAEKQFRSLKRRYPTHPLPYFLLGLSEWWKIVPTNIQTTQYDDTFFAYMDSTIHFGEKLYEADNKNFEAAFFLAAAYGFQARLHSERSNWRKATVASKRSLEYLEKSKVANSLSPEFLFGEALRNYYAVWIHENYALLRPVLVFFDKGNKQLGIQQLRYVAENGFYTGTEAKMFLMKILANEENNPDAAMAVSRQLAANYPDNAYFQRFYARLTFIDGNFEEAERVAKEILDKINHRMPGYEAVSGRYASYILAYLSEHKYHDLTQAKHHYQNAIRFAEQTNEKESGYFIYSHLHLARIYDQEKNVPQARAHYAIVKKVAERKSEPYQEANAYLRKRRR